MAKSKKPSTPKPESHSGETHCGFVAILGAPNAGKSTLLNTLVGQKLAIVTPKAQTTRSRIRGICMEGEAQIIFIDTPGIFAPEEKFEKAMVASAWAGVADADLIVVLMDAARGLDRNTHMIIDTLASEHKKAVLLLNKIDLIKDKNRLLAVVDEMKNFEIFNEIFMISAEEGDGLKEVRKYLAETLPKSPWLYPADQVTDISERLLASEVTREKLFMQLDQELPYSLTVETEAFETKRDKSIVIRQVIYVQRESQKTIVLGKGGARVKAIGEASRRDLSRMWDTKVHLFLFVKVRERWKENPEIYKYLGLDF